MWPTLITILSVVASSTVVQGTSLIDVLNQSGATQFAALITSDPTIAAVYNSSSVQTVFAPIDSSLLSEKLKRQTSLAGERLGLYHGIQQSNTLGQLSVGSGKAAVTNDKTANLKGQAQVVVTNPSNSTGSGQARRWDTASWSTTSQTKWSTLTFQSHHYNSTTTLPPPPPPPETQTTCSTLIPPPALSYTITTILPPPPPHTYTLYSTLTPPLPETVSVYSTLPAPPPETVTVYYNVPPPPPETVSVYSTISPIPETVSIYSTISAAPETVTIYSTSPTPTPKINPPSLLKIYSGLGNYVNIIQANIPYDGGLIHIVDNYFTIPELISETALADNHTTFVNLGASANLTSTIDNTPEVTCFIPTNVAFAQPNSTSSYATTASLLLGHVIPNFLGYLPSLTNGATFTTQGGTNITVTITAGNYYINNAKIIASNLIVDNGVCHVIDSVITPTTVVPVQFTGDASPSFKRDSPILALWSFAICLGITLLV